MRWNTRLGGSASGGCGGGVFLFFCSGGASGLLDASAARGLGGSLQRVDEGAMARLLAGIVWPAHGISAVLFFQGISGGGGLL